MNQQTQCQAVYSVYKVSVVGALVELRCRHRLSYRYQTIDPRTSNDFDPFFINNSFFSINNNAS